MPHELEVRDGRARAPRREFVRLVRRADPHYSTTTAAATAVRRPSLRLLSALSALFLHTDDWRRHSTQTASGINSPDQCRHSQLAGCPLR
jgi:hypothetical protein